MRKSRLPALLLLATWALAACASTGEIPAATAEQGAAEQRTAREFDELRGRPPLLAAFLRQMPKGGDLHNHLSGAIYAESFIRWAADGGLCVERATLVLAAPPCKAPGAVPAAAAYRDGTLFSALVDAFSMRDFVPGAQSGHDHFFATFDKFGAAEAGHDGDMLAEIAARAAAENVSYLELMWSPGMPAARRLGAGLGWDDDLGRQRDRLMASGIAGVVAAARQQIAAAEAAMRERLRCDTAEPLPGCAVTLRFLAQVIRTFPPAQVYAQSVFAFALVRADPHVVGVNLVAPEDDPVTLRDYALQMRMLGFLERWMPEVPLSLHAGELAPGLVPPEDLRFHIRSAVEVADARRIGHGVDLADEDDPWTLLREMARKRVLVEINLTSNALILGVAGDRHPFPDYRRAGVPLALSTDDPGVSRIDLTHEYLRAALTYGLGYRDLKELARNSLEYAFLPGDSLWRGTQPFAPAEACAGSRLGAPDPAPSCRDLLGRSAKAREQWHLEAAFTAFEARPRSERD